jgi:hypothetical protein
VQAAEPLSTFHGTPHPFAPHPAARFARQQPEHAQALRPKPFTNHSSPSQLNLPPFALLPGPRSPTNLELCPVQNPKTLLNKTLKPYS